MNDRFLQHLSIYKKNENGEKVSILPNLKLGMEFGKTRVITASVNNNVNKVVYDAEGNVVKQEEGVEYTEENGYKIQETPINAESVKTVDNYKRAEKIIEKRLKEAEKLGFTTCIIPESNKRYLKESFNLQIIGVKNINEAMKGAGIKWEKQRKMTLQKYWK